MKPSRRSPGRERDEALVRNVDRKFDRFEQYFITINEKLDALAAALIVLLDDAATQEKADMVDRGLRAKIAEKKTVFDGLVAARDALEAKLNEAKEATGMGETNAAIDEALAMLDTFVDPKAGTSPITENTAAAEESANGGGAEE